MTSRHRLLFDSYITPPPDNGNKTSVGYRVEPNFDSNMVIVLVALLSALICALGLNSIVRCVLRWTRPIGPESADRVSVRLAASSLKKEALNSIPVVAYKPGLRILATDCPICLGDFVEGEDVRVFPRCDHGFHVVCIDKWLALHSSCPTCRQPVIGRSTGGGAELVRVQID